MITAVQGNYNEAFGSNTLVVTMDNPTTGGNFLSVLLGWQSADAIVSIIDDMGNTYVHATGANGLATNGGWNQSTDIYYCENSIGGATTLTILLAGTADGVNCVWGEYAGVLTSGSFDQADTSSGGGSVIGATVTPAEAGELLLCVGAEGQYVLNSTVDAPWTKIQASNNDGWSSANYINPPLSPTECHFNPTGPTTPFDFSTSTAAFKAAAGGTDFKKNASMFLVS